MLGQNESSFILTYAIRSVENRNDRSISLHAAYLAGRVLLVVDDGVLKKDVQRTFILGQRMTGDSRRKRLVSDAAAVRLTC